MLKELRYREDGRQSKSDAPNEVSLAAGTVADDVRDVVLRQRRAAILRQKWETRSTGRSNLDFQLDPVVTSTCQNVKARSYNGPESGEVAGGRAVPKSITP